MRGQHCRSGGAADQETLEFASFCLSYKRFCRTAVTFYRDAFTREPRLVDSTTIQHRYNAACAAALAAAGQGEDAGKVTDGERVALRKQTLDWLRADLAAIGKLLDRATPAQKQLMQKRLSRWREDADLASLRDDKARAALPDGGRQAWQKLWADVAALIQKTDDNR